MSDRGWGYSRSYGGSGGGGGGKQRYMSHGSNNYTRSGDRDRNRFEGRDSSYTRSSSGHQRGHYQRDRYEHSRGVSSSHGRHSYARDDYENSGRSSNMSSSISRYREDLRQPSSRLYEDNSQPHRFSDDVGPAWEKRSVHSRERSPSLYINRSPPRVMHASQQERSRKSPSPFRVAIPSRSREREVTPISNRPVGPWGPDTFTGSTDRRPKVAVDEPFQIASGKPAMEVVKLMERLKEYVPWLTSRKANIFENRRDKELKDEVDDIDWCLDVIHDIKADENVGMHTLKRAQDMVMRLITKGPVISAPVEDDARYSGVHRDDIYSARSPSPPNLKDGVQFSRRAEVIDPNPRVIPTDRNEFYLSPSTVVPPARTGASLLNSFPVSSSLQNRADHFYSNPRAIPVERTEPPLSENTRIMREAEKSKDADWDYVQVVVPDPEPPVDKTIYEYDHGQSGNANTDEPIFERRKPKSTTRSPEKEVEADSKSKSPTKLFEDEEMRRRMKQWEESSDEDEILIIRKGKKPQDQDMRVYVAESRPNKGKTLRSDGEIRSPEPEDISPYNNYGFSKDMINPINPASLHPRPPVPPPIPPIPQSTVSISPQVPPAQSQPNIPVHLMNMNQPLFNPFLNLSGMLLQSGLLPGFPRASLASGNLFPPANSNAPINPSENSFNFSNSNLSGKDAVNQPQPNLELTNQTQEEIMLSRIKARAAESFRVKGRASGFENASHGSSGDTIHNLDQAQADGSIPILDPRLKPRQPRELMSDPRRDLGNRLRSSEDRINRFHIDRENKSRNSIDHRDSGRPAYDGPSWEHRNRQGGIEKDGKTHPSDEKNSEKGGHESGDNTERVKRSFIHPPERRGRYYNRSQRNSGEHYHEHRRQRSPGELEIVDSGVLSSDEKEERIDRVSRNFTRRDHRSEIHDKTSKSEDFETLDSGDHEKMPVTTKYPSLSARIQAVREKLNQSTIEKKGESSHQNRIEEIRREAEILHPIGNSSTKKSHTESPPPEPESSIQQTTTKRGRKKKVISEKQSPATETEVQNNEDESAKGLRRSPRTRAQTVKPSVTNKLRQPPKRSPVKSPPKVKTPVNPVKGSKSKACIPETQREDKNEPEAHISDSDDELRIDIPESPIGNYVDRDNDSPSKVSGLMSPSLEPVESRPKTMSFDEEKSSNPETSKSCLPAGADELIKSLLLSSMSPQEAEILRSSEDYLASTLARLKEELSAKVRERTRKSSGDQAESSVSSTTHLEKPTETSDSKEEDEKNDEVLRSRSTCRKKPQTKRRSSLEKLHDALREMNFDSMMPLGPRRALTKQAQDEHLSSDVKEHEKGNEELPSKVPKLSPVVILENVDKSLLGELPHLYMEVPLMKQGPTKKRKYVGKKVNDSQFHPIDDDSNSSLDSSHATETNSFSKKPKLIAQQGNPQSLTTPLRCGTIIGPNDLIVNEGLAKIKLESDFIPIKKEAVDDDMEMGSFGGVFPDTEMMDLGKDLQLQPGDFGLTEDDNLLFHSEDLRLSLSDEDELRTIKSEDFDFVINAVSDQSGKLPEPQPSLPEKPKPAKKRGRAAGGESKRGRKKKKGLRGAAAGFSCKICHFVGKKPVEHYVNEHPGVTIPEARLSEQGFQLLQESNKSDSPQLMEIRFTLSDTIRCVFCHIILSNISIYCHHLTCHTGEFRFQCSVCQYKFSNRHAAIAHGKAHKKDNIEVPESLMETKIAIEEGRNEFHGYLCRECNYFQIHYESIRYHLDSTKHSETDVVCIKFTASGHVEFKQPKAGLASLKFKGEQAATVLPESSKAVFYPPEDLKFPEPSMIHSIEVKRFKPTRKSRVSDLVERLQNELSRKEQLEDSLLPTIMESPSDIFFASVDTVNWLVDTIVCGEELEEELQNFTFALKESEESFLGFYQSDFRRNSCADDILQDSSDDEEEPNDFYLEPPAAQFEDYFHSCDRKSVSTEFEYETQRDLLGFEDSSLEEIPSEPLREDDNSRQWLAAFEQNRSSPVPMNNIHNTSPTPSIGSLYPGDGNVQEDATDLEGTDLYRCANIGCDFKCLTLGPFKDHISSCTFAVHYNGVRCFHCEKAFKNWKPLVEHIEIHGKCKLLCSLCSFKARVVPIMKRHFKSVHKILISKGHKCDVLPPGDSLWFPTDVYGKRIELQQLQDNPLSFVPRIQFLPDEVDDIPRSCIMPSEVHCALCKYSTKVRVNMIRHLHLHKEADVNGTTLVPIEAPVNPVPWLERKERMFDKMTNWAGSSHRSKGDVSASVREQLPQFVLDQFRYICSVPTCNQLTVNDSMLRAHMKALHSEVNIYVCPHCQQNDPTKSDLFSTVSIDKIANHLKLHGPKLLKCGHCDFINIQTKAMEKHVAEKHIEKKPIHYVIRNQDSVSGAIAGRRNSMEEVPNTEKWKCGVCRIVCPSWEEVRDHCKNIHSIKSQFMCDSCQFATNSIYQVTNHITSRICVKKEGESRFILVYFARGELGEDKVRYPIWRRASARDHLRGIFFLHENENNPDAGGATTPLPSTSSVVTKGATLIPKSPAKSKLFETSGKQGKRKQQFSKPIAPSRGQTETIPPYLCCECSTYRTTTIDAMKTHLRQHLNYHRFSCKLCGNRSWTMVSFKLHIETEHGEPYNAYKHLEKAPKNAVLESQLNEWLLRCTPDPLRSNEMIQLSNPIAGTNLDDIVFCEEIMLLD